MAEKNNIERTENDSNKNTDDLLKYQRRVWGIKIAEFICVGILLLVLLMSFIVVIYVQFSANEQTYQLAAELCNTFTGIILGFVAMTVSLIGMILSFHNTKQSEQSNLESAKEFAKLSSTTDEIKKLEQELSAQNKTFKTDLEKLSQIAEIKEKIDTLIKEMQREVDNQKGDSTDGHGSVQQNNQDDQSNKDEKHSYDDRQDC